MTAPMSWPSLPLEQWQPTRDTVHLWTQIAGKTRLALAPQVNHWWSTALYVTARGLTTSLMPYRGGGAEIEFDFTRHELTITTTNGAARRMPLAPRTVADFYAEYRSHLDALGIDVAINRMPNEIPDAIPFDSDTVHAQYDAEAMHQFWLSLVSAHRVMSQFRAGWRGKASPVHFFWGAFDLAVTRFSGRPPPSIQAASRTARTLLWPRPIARSFPVAATGPAAPRRASSTLTRIPRPRASASSGSPPTRPTSTSSSANSSCRMPPSGRPPTLKPCLLSFLETTFQAAYQLARWPAG